jgi:hypothetical protein
MARARVPSDTRIRNIKGGDLRERLTRRTA